MSSVKTAQPNETMRALDRAADRLKIGLLVTGRNRREFIAFGRTFRYAPCGKGVVRVQTFIDGQPEAEQVRTVEQMEGVFLRVVTS